MLGFVQLTVSDTKVVLRALHLSLVRDKIGYMPINSGHLMNPDIGILLHIPKFKTVSYQNNFYVKPPSVWSYPGYIRNASNSQGLT